MLSAAQTADYERDGFLVLRDFVSEAACAELKRRAEALVDAFEVPENDRFVVFHQHRDGELIFDRAYGGGPRSDDVILFHVTTGRTRSADTTARFFRRLVDNLQAAPGVRPEDVMIVIANSAIDDWSFGSGVPAGKAMEIRR